VMDAIKYASKHYVMLDELHDRVGERIASLLGCEAAMVTAGAASALTLGTAAVLTGSDRRKIVDLPNLAGMKSEVIVQKSHRFGYDHAVRNCGVRLVEVETAAELERAINPNTAMMLFYNNNNAVGQIRDQEFVALGKKHRIPTFNDCAADVPPVENLWKYTKMGFDLVTFSGGKGIRGPQSAGLLLASKPVIAAARLNGPPNSETIGRGMKVNKEEMFGMYAALKAYLERDHKKEWQEWLDRAKHIGSQLETVQTVKTETVVDPGPANAFPSLKVTWDESKIKIKPEQVVAALKSGTPSIVANGGKDHLTVGVVLLRPDQVDIVAGRVKSILQQAV